VLFANQSNVIICKSKAFFVQTVNAAVRTRIYIVRIIFSASMNTWNIEQQINRTKLYYLHRWNSFTLRSVPGSCRRPARCSPPGSSRSCRPPR
jgi:hypothetical protein